MTCQAGDNRFAAFDIVMKRRGRSRWKWSVRTTDGHAVMCGSECSRGGARYKAQRALFLLLCASASRVPTLTLEELVRRSLRRSLTDRGFKSPRGGKWYPSSVANLISRAQSSFNSKGLQMSAQPALASTPMIAWRQNPLEISDISS